MVSAAWVLVYYLNGKEHQQQPSVAEACVIQMVTMGHPGGHPPYCLNTETGAKMTRPAECPVPADKKLYLYCDKTTTMAKEKSNEKDGKHSDDHGNSSAQQR